MLVLMALMISVAIPVTTQAKTSAQTRVTQTEKKIKKKFKRVKIITRTKHNFNKVWKQTAHRKGKGYYLVEKFQGTALNKYIGRDPNGYYKFGGRGSEMVKFKLYKEAEFTITGLSEGLRDEDMCFTLETDDGIPFKAKPMGSRDIK